MKIDDWFKKNWKGILFGFLLGYGIFLYINPGVLGSQLSQSMMSVATTSDQMITIQKDTVIKGILFGIFGAGFFTLLQLISEKMGWVKKW